MTPPLHLDTLLYLRDHSPAIFGGYQVDLQSLIEQASAQQPAVDAAGQAVPADQLPHAEPSFSDHIAEMRQRARAAVGAVRTAAVFGDGDDNMAAADAAIDVLAIEADTNLTMCLAWRKRAEEAEASLAWRDISTAPKDGTVILVAAMLRGRCIVGHGFWWRAGYWVLQNMPDAHQHLESIERPTHWMPLPDPPVVGSHGNQSVSETSGSAQSEAPK